MSKSVCMIVEDEALIALALGDEFEDAGFVVSGPFGTCGAALVKLRREAPPDVAVLDTMLQDGTCLELARELAALGVPFVVYSGRDESHDKAAELAGAPWITKPALHLDVVAVVRDLLGRGAPTPMAASSATEA